jgi:hypothetical protein
MPMAAFEGIAKILGVAGSITTALGLAALSVLAAYLLAAQWLRGKENAAKGAIAKGDDSALARLLGGVAVPLEDLSAEQKYGLANEELRSRYRQRVLGYTLLFFAFLALLGFAFALAFGSRAADERVSSGTVKLDLIGAFSVLRYVPAGERQTVCPTLMSKEDCSRAAPMIAALIYQQPSTQQQDVLEDAVSRGGLTTRDVRDLAPCGGKLDFKVVGNLLACADGTPLPQVNAPGPERTMVAQQAIVLHASVTSAELPLSRVAEFIAVGRPPDLRGPLAHLIISRSGSIVQTAPFTRVASHVGRSAPWNGQEVTNRNAIGIELLHSGNYQTDSYPSVQLQVAQAVIRTLAQAYDLKTLVGHDEVASPAGRKTDPGPGVAGRMREATGLQTPS